MSNTTQLITGVVLIIVLLGGGYYYLRQSDSAVVSTATLPSGDNTSQSTTSPTRGLAQDKTLQRLNRLEDVDINAEFLSADIFESLESFGIAIQSQPVGRDNPFSTPQLQVPAKIKENNLDFSAEQTTTNTTSAVQSNVNTSSAATTSIGTSTATTSVDELPTVGTTSTSTQTNQPS